MGASAPGLQFAAALLVFLIPISLALVVPSVPRERQWAILAAAVGAAGSVTVDALTASVADAPARVLDAALAASLAASVALLAATRLGGIGGAVFGSAWTLIVFQPVATAVVGSVPPLTEVAFGTIDLGGVLATHVSLAGSLLTLSILPSPGHERPSARRVGWARASLACALLIVGATAWMLGVDRVLDDGSTRILLNAVIGMGLGAAIWLAVEKISHGRVRPLGLVAGAASAWAAVGMASVFLASVAMVVSAVLGAAVGASVATRSRSERAGPTRAVSVALLSATLTGGIVLGLLADGIALSSTGSLGLVVAQSVAVFAVGLASAFSGVLCWGLGAAATVVMTRRERGRQWAIPDSN
jgi:hypothetical protein